jgi:polysaccharide biosynthesis transport protein
LRGNLDQALEAVVMHTSVVRRSPGPLPAVEVPFEEPLHLRDYWNVVRRRRGLAFSIFLLILAAGLARVVLLRPVYQATAQILIERQIPSVLEFEQHPRAQALDDFYQTQYRLLQSRLLARQVVDRVGLLNDPEFGGPRSAAQMNTATQAAPGTSPDMEEAIDTFLAALKIEPIRDSQMVSVSFSSRRPELAAQAVNTLAEVYIQQTLDFRYRVSAEAGSWLTNEANEQGRKVQAAEAALQEFKEKEGLVSIDERRTLLEQRLKDLGSALTAAKTRRLQKEAVYGQMQAAGNPEELPGAMESPLIQGLRAELAQLERQGAQLAASGVLDQHPDAIRLNAQIEGTRQKIALEARRVIRAAQNDYAAAAGEEARVAEALEATKSESLELAKRGLRYDALKRDLEASQTLSDQLVARQKQTDVARDIRASNIHVVDPAIVPHDPVRPRPVRDMALAALLGLLCAVAAAFTRDYFDTSVGRPSDVRRLGLPLLGVIPETTSRNIPLIAARGQRREPFAEGYRLLRASLRAPEDKGHGQILLVTSTLAGEGKSLTSLNLALTLAGSEERVLLIDADLRRPVLHELLHTKPAPGLVDVMTNGAVASQAIRKVDGTRLAFLPCGTPIERSPADILASGAMAELLARLRPHYDRIVLDTPPAGTIADALALSRLVDGVLVVARSGKVARGELLHVLDRLAHAGAPLWGVVLNRVRPNRHPYDYGPYLLPDSLAGGKRRPLTLGPVRADSPGRFH